LTWLETCRLCRLRHASLFLAAMLSKIFRWIASPELLTLQVESYLLAGAPRRRRAQQRANSNGPAGTC